MSDVGRRVPVFVRSNLAGKPKNGDVGLTIAVVVVTHKNIINMHSALRSFISKKRKKADFCPQGDYSLNFEKRKTTEEMQKRGVQSKRRAFTST